MIRFYRCECGANGNQRYYPIHLKGKSHQSRMDLINIRRKMLLIHQDTNHDLHKIIYGLHAIGTLDYYNYFGTRVTEQYRHHLYTADPCDSEYIVAGIIGRDVVV